MTDSYEIPEQGDCPDCLEGVMRYCESEHYEPHGEYVRSQGYECSRCGFIDDVDSVTGTERQAV